MKKDDLVGVGKILRSEGAGGELKLRLFAKDVLDPSISSVFIEEKDEVGKYKIESLRRDRNAHILKLEGVDTLSQADSLAGRKVYAEEVDFLPPAKGCIYDFHVIGSRVETLSGEFLGIVQGWVPAGDGNLLVVAGSRREYLIPFIEDIFIEIDTENKKIRIDPPEGLLELNEI